MNVIPFSYRAANGGFTLHEMNAIREIAERQMGAGVVAAVEYGATERGDPQAYLLGPEPDHDCVLCVTRIGRAYVVEDGAGAIVAEVGTLRAVTERAARFLARRRAGLVARITVAWYAARELFEERIEPAMAESIEAATYFAPQLAAYV